MALIFALSAQPKPPPIPGLGFLETIYWGDKVKHVAAYAILSALVWRALDPTRAALRRVVLAMAISVLYGLTDEFHQRFVPNRTCDICDLTADAFGALAAAIILRKVGDKHVSNKLGKAGRREDIRGEGQEASQSGRQP